jgi:hypothetical protein
MNCRRRYNAVYIVGIILFLFFFAVGVQGKVKGAKVSIGVADVKDCEGVRVTQCELAKDLILSLKMGEDLSCEACFIQLLALGIAPGDDWSYEDPHKVVTLEEIKEVLLEIDRSYNNGTLRLDGHEVAAGINSFCKGIKGISTPSSTTNTGEKQMDEGKPASGEK